MKIYEVIIQDEWNNLTLLGFYKNLDDAIPEINSFLSVYGEGKYSLKPGDLKEYASTFCSVFDTNVSEIFEDEAAYDELCGVMIRGFILDSNTISEIEKILK